MNTEFKNIPIEVYAELTPNPNSMKFVAGIMLLENGVVEYFSREEAKYCPLAQQLFDFTGVKKIFITSNFVTVTKEDNIDWYDITNILREFIRGFLTSGEQVFSADPLAHPIIRSETKPEQKPVTIANDDVEVAEDPDAEKKIIELLDEYVRPAVEGDGGAIHFQSYVNGVVNVVLKGSCSGCPSSTVTLKSGIENLLKKLVPGVKEVVAVEEQVISQWSIVFIC